MKKKCYRIYLSKHFKLNDFYYYYYYDRNTLLGRHSLGLCIIERDEREWNGRWRTKGEREERKKQHTARGICVWCEVNITFKLRRHVAKINEILFFFILVAIKYEWMKVHDAAVFTGAKCCCGGSLPVFSLALSVSWFMDGRLLFISGIVRIPHLCDFQFNYGRAFREKEWKRSAQVRNNFNGIMMALSNVWVSFDVVDTFIMLTTGMGSGFVGNRIESGMSSGVFWFGETIYRKMHRSRVQWQMMRRSPSRKSLHEKCKRGCNKHLEKSQSGDAFKISWNCDRQQMTIITHLVIGFSPFPYVYRIVEMYL